MSDDKFLERLRGDARRLRYEPDDVALTRLAARIRSRLSDQSVAQFLASWFRPLAASLCALAVAAGIGIAVLDRSDISLSPDAVEYSMGGDVYRVGD